MPVESASPFYFVTEKKFECGEDGEPIARNFTDVGAVVAVFDGMGGAGASQVQVDSTYTNIEGMCSMAYLASRAASRAVSGAIAQFGKSDLGALKVELEKVITEKLKNLAERPGGRGAGPRIRGTMLSEYPTTVAIGIVRPSPDEFGERCVTVYWAGDSRVYAIIPSELVPLQLLTIDHTETGGGGDAALDKFASSSGLNLDQREYELPREAAVIAMTDGCYGYMTPFQLMLLLIKRLQFSKNYEDWLSAIKSDIVAVAGDDASFAISFGEGGFDALKMATSKIYANLEPLIFAPEGPNLNPFIIVHDPSKYSAFFENCEAKRRPAELGTIMSNSDVAPVSVTAPVLVTPPVSVIGPISVTAPVSVTKPGLGSDFTRIDDTKKGFKA